MKTNKNSKMSLEQYRGIFLKLGFVISISLVLFAFEWATADYTPPNTDFDINLELDEDILNVRVEEPKPEPPKPQKQVFEELRIVDDELDIDETEMVIIDAEIDETDKIEMVQLTIETPEEEVFIISESMPEFPGGMEALGKFLQRNVDYPELAREAGIEGKVFVRFVVGADGTVKRAEIVRGVDQLLDTEAVRVVKQMPRWKPGSNRGKNVPVWFTLPINFKLD